MSDDQHSNCTGAITELKASVQASLEACFRSVHAEEQALKTNITKLTSENSELQNQLGEANTKLKKLEDIVAEKEKELRTEKVKFEEELEAANVRIKELTQSAKENEAKFKQVDAKLKEFKNTVDKKDAEIRRAKNRHEIIVQEKEVEIMQIGSYPQVIALN